MDDFLKIVIGISVILIIISLAMPIINYRTTFEWWRKNDPKGIYKCFSLTDIAYYNSNVLIYRIVNALQSGPSQFKHDWWIYLITGFIQGSPKGVVEGGYVTPKSLCKSLVPDTPPQTNLPVPSGQNQFEWPTDRDGWISVLKGWGEITFSDDGEQKYTVGNPDGWKNNPDNFLNTWGIPPTSPMVIGFITNWTMYQNSKTYNEALYPLLGLGVLGSGSGGWWGFLQHGDDFGGFGIDEINRIVWSNDVPTEIDTGVKNSSKCNAGSVTNGALGGAGVGSMIGSGLANAMVSAGASAGPTGLILGVLFGGLAGGLSSAFSSNCF